MESNLKNGLVRIEQSSSLRNDELIFIQMIRQEREEGRREEQQRNDERKKNQVEDERLVTE
jgi:hypothetical protein